MTLEHYWSAWAESVAEGRERAPFRAAREAPGTQWPVSSKAIA
jgi:hypothetical protein